MKWWLTALVIAVVLGTVTIWAAVRLRDRVEPPIRVGILHSMTGAVAISEKSMIDAEVLALEEINRRETYFPGIAWSG